MKISANIAMLRPTSSSEKRAPSAGAVALPGSERQPSSSTSAPSGTLSANSHGQDATDRMAAATVGPATDEVATTSELIAIPRPSCADG